MVRLEKSEALGRKIRQDDIAKLGISTWDLACQAIREGRSEESLELVDYACMEAKMLHDTMVSIAEMSFTFIADNFGEEEVDRLIRLIFQPKVEARLSAPLSVEEFIQMYVELMRGHFSGSITITEEPDRYVVKYDPCGSGGRLRRLRAVGTTKKPYPWSWNKAGVSYYCAHCCISNETLPIELRGYPIKIILPGDKPEDPCVHLYYKKPELIPEEYFTRVGKTKTI